MAVLMTLFIVLPQDLINCCRFSFTKYVNFVNPERTETTDNDKGQQLITGQSIKRTSAASLVNVSNHLEKIIQIYHALKQM